MKDYTDQARQVFQQDRYATELTGIDIDFAGEHESRCTLALGPQHRNARGVVMGGVLFTLADFAAAIAANSECMDNELQWVSLNASIHYLSPALGERLVAHCTSVKHGRSTALYRTTIENPDNGNKTVAVVETTMIHI